MAKYYGRIGFVNTVETSPSVWEEKILIREYPGDVLSMTKSWASTEGVNDDVRVNVRISILADLFAMERVHSIRFAEYMGVNWKVTSVDPSKFPRLILTLGEEYHGETKPDKFR